MEEEAIRTDKESGRLGEEAGSSGQGTGVNLAAYTRGAWKGSDVSQAEIDWLYRSRRIPEEVFYRIPGKELEPAPQPGDVVVFAAHFERGFGLPASDFFRRFLDFYELQPHHLPGNAIFYLSSFVSFMEGFVGLWPTVETFARFYNLRINSIQDPKLPTPKPTVQCGACILTPRQGSPYYKFTGLESCRAWQETFFYVRNSGPSDFINLPAYVPGAPARTNWRYNPQESHEETNRIVRYMETLNDTTNICADDIVRTFVSRRVLPLQRRAHKICQMTGRMDPTRITTFSLSKTDVVLKAKQICKTQMPVKWEWGMQPFSRQRPPSSQDFPRISAEEPESFAPKRVFEDDVDPDPYTIGKVHKMGPTHSRRPTDQDRQVLEHVTPLDAEVGDPLASRVRKTPASDTGSSDAPAPKRQKKPGSGPPGRKRKHEIPVSFGPPLELSRSASGMRPEAAKDSSKPQDPRRADQPNCCPQRLSLQHQLDLEAQRDETAKLKHQLIQAGLQHTRSLKEAIAAGDAKVEEARKQFAEAEEQLRRELAEEKKLLKLEQERNTALSAAQTSLGQMIKDTDAKALKLFPDSQVRTEATVSKLRTENLAPDASAPWTTEDHLAALYSRITHMRVVDRHLSELPEAALKIFKCLWPEETVPDNLTILSKRLQDAGWQLSEWRHSAACAGADAALRFACSWYEDLDLDALHSMRGDAPTDKVPEKTAARHDRAYRIASYASTSTFIPPPADLEEEFTEDEEEEEEEAGDGEAEAELEATDDPAAGTSEQTPKASAAPEPTPEAPATREPAPESSSPLYL
ncbi:hypothetical protein QYE76_007012 [Lolium multiflorum]|uniref:Transposase (putative) gypsy type domain-containing protein n=1 Tax=Lolium multiflorum TaxID=4521 RepID=A0AAD8RXM7_LOLMU|nr:hypothetical protein QYE76_007012 [Lolium multiflorum]